MKVAGDPGPAKATNRRLRARQGSESAPSPEPQRQRDALIDEAIALFGPRYGRAIGREEARQMIERLTAFFELLAEWEHRVQAGRVEGDVAA